MGVLEESLEDIERVPRRTPSNCSRSIPILRSRFGHTWTASICCIDGRRNVAAGEIRVHVCRPVPKTDSATIPFCAKLAVVEWGSSTKPGRSRWTAGSP